MREGQYKYQVTKQKLAEYAARLPSGEPLPNRNKLAKQCGVARVTLERAISELLGEGVLVSIDGRGTYAAGGESAPAHAGPRLDRSLWALLVYSVTKGLTPHILRGVEDFAHQNGISLIVCNTDNQPEREAQYLKGLLESNVSGIVLIPSIHSAPDRQVLDALRQKGVSLVACSRQIPGYDFPGAFQNFFHAGFMATQHLLEMGCRRLAYFATSHYCSVEDRLQGYLAALGQHNAQHPGDPARDQSGLKQWSDDLAGDMEEFLRRHPDTDGAYLFNDRMAVHFYAAMQRLGLTPGRDIRVISSEDSGFCSAFRVPLSAIDFPSYRMGALSAQQLYDLQKGTPESELKRVALSGELNIRASSAGV